MACAWSLSESWRCVENGPCITRKIFEYLTRTRKIILKNGRGMAVASQKNIYKNIEKIEKIEFETATCQNIKDVGEDNLCDLPYSMHAFYSTTQ